MSVSDEAKPAARAVRHGQVVRQRMSANGKKSLPLRKAMKKIYIKYIIVAAAAVGAIAGKTVFMYRGEYEAVRSAPAYRALFDNNTVRAIEG